MLIKGCYNMEMFYIKYVCKVYKMMKLFLLIKCIKVKRIIF